MKQVLVIDNYDSFTYNLVHLLESLGGLDIKVYRNDKFNIEEVSKFEKILLSPGPGIPKEAGLMPEVVKKFSDTKNILGVCLGHQCIAEVFGAKLVNMPSPLHGKTSEIELEQNEKLFAKLPKKITVGRYHSWLVDNKNLPQCLNITAVDGSGNIMAISHKTLNVRGVQFHPESVMTEGGAQMIKNWVES